MPTNRSEKSATIGWQTETCNTFIKTALPKNKTLPLTRNKHPKVRTKITQSL
jgi:hypothetical protein